MPVEVNCSTCGEKLERWPNEVEEADNFFCNRSCHAEWQKSLSKEDHSCWKGGKVSVECEWCGKEKKVTPARVERQDNFFCDHECFGKFNSERYSGENNPNYKGGDWEHNYRGESWAPIRNKVRERDSYTCQNCNKGMEELGQIPDCHHIKPEHKFEEPEEAHFEDNLVLLCRDCHNLFDNLSEEEQRERLNFYPNES